MSNFQHVQYVISEKINKTLSIKQELHLEKREESKNKSTSWPTVLGCGTDEENRRKPFCTTICHLQARPRVSSPEPPHLTTNGRRWARGRRESPKVCTQQGGLRARGPGEFTCFPFLCKQCSYSMNNCVTSKDVSHFHHHPPQKLTDK